MNTLLHIGVPVASMPEDAVHIPRMGLYRTDPDKHPLHWEYLYFLPDSPFPAAVRENIHAAYQTDDPASLLDGAETLGQAVPSASGKNIIRFIRKNGVVMELIYREKNSEV